MHLLETPLELGSYTMAHMATFNISQTRTASEPPVMCNAVHQFNNSAAECQFVRNTSACGINEGFIDYTTFVYCDLPGYLPFAMAILVLWWLVLFVTLAVTADDFFCPSLVVVSKTLRISDNIAGVTFLAFGNGAPDVFSAIAAVGSMKNGDAGLAIGALFGAGIFVTTVVAGSIAVVCPFSSMQRPFLRDVIFYIAAVFFAFYTLYDHTIDLMESVGFLVLYVLYVLVVVVGRYIFKRQQRNANRLISQRIEANEESDDDILDVPRITSINQDVHNSHSSGIGSNDLDTYDDNDDDEPIWNIEQLADLGLIIQPLHKSLDNPHTDDHSAQALVDILKPFSVEEWSQARCFTKAYMLVKTPLFFLLTLTIPVVDTAEKCHNWNRYLNTAHCVISPMVALFLSNHEGALYKVHGVVPMWALVLLIGCLLAVAVWCTSVHDRPPVYHAAFSFLAFVIAVIWIESIANEIVNLLQTVGIVFSIGNTLLGLTFLAWGNSIGDCISNVTMARQGFPRTGISACFGGPLFNMLMGIGIPFTIKLLQTPHHQMKMTFSPIDTWLSICLFASLVCSLVIIPLMGFHFRRGYGFFLYVLYVVFVVVAILLQTHVITI